MHSLRTANYGGITSSSISSMRLLTLRMANAPIERKINTNKIIKNILRNRAYRINRIAKRLNHV